VTASFICFALRKQLPRRVVGFRVTLCLFPVPFVRFRTFHIVHTSLLRASYLCVANLIPVSQISVGSLNRFNYRSCKTMCYNNFWFWPFFFLCFGRTPVPAGNKNLNSGESPQFEKGSRNLYYVLRRLQPFRLNFRAELCFSNQPPLKLQVPKHCQDEDHVCQITM